MQLVNFSKVGALPAHSYKDGTESLSTV